MALPFFGTGMKTNLFQSCGHCFIFQICWPIECSTFTTSSIRIWNSSTGIPSPPLALFVVMLSKTHLTSHARMSGSRWVITPSWLSGSWRSFLYSSVYSSHLSLISSASVRSKPFLSYIVPIFAWTAWKDKNIWHRVSIWTRVVFRWGFRYAWQPDKGSFLWDTKKPLGKN